ncbi:MAG: hypothetical protein ACAI43_25240 [Phycisphaerae bacterium]|nr:hypothetical protein [Tepidisphaeraceae bacterium]
MLRSLLVVAALVGSPVVGFAQPAGNGAGGAPAAPAGERRPDVMGRVVNVTEDGRTIMLALPPAGATGAQPAGRPEELRITLTERTRQVFMGVGEGQAKATPGLMAMVWLEAGSKDVAQTARFMKQGEDRPDVQGRVTSVSPDGLTIGVETRDRDPQTGQEKPPGAATIRLAPYTQHQYFGVEPGGAKPTVDYLVIAWFEKGSKETAARVRFLKNEPASAPGAVAPR